MANNDSSLPHEWKEIVFEKIQEIVRASKFLIPSENSYYCSSIAGFRAKVTNLSEVVRCLIKNVVDTSEVLIRQKGAPREYEDENFDDLYDNYEIIVDLIDSLLERASKSMELSSAQEIKRAEIFAKNPVIVSLEQKQTSLGSNKLTTQFSVLHSENIPRPQLKFKEKVDNTNTPFVIKLTEKANAQIPLENVNFTKSGEILNDLKASTGDLPSESTFNDRQTINPYFYEITHIEYPPYQLSAGAEIVYQPLEQTPFRWIDTTERLDELLISLSSCDLIAVDLEHHSYRSYLGFTCLIQISTRHEDFIVDALSLRSSLQILNRVFTDSKILKIFHGSEMDIKWLQKDFGIYVVNMFDTGQAARILCLPHYSLDYLLKRYCNVSTTKQYQLADWRIRPLTSKMIEYARKDTHYLPYVYDRMKNELIEASSGDISKLYLAYERSAHICCSTFTKEIYDQEEGKGPGGWEAALKKVQPELSPEMTTVFKAIHGWRDAVARQEDESLGFVIPTTLLATLAREMPVNVQQLLSVCRTPTPMIKQYATDIVRLINDARAMYIRELNSNLPNKVDTLFDNVLQPLSLNDVSHSSSSFNIVEGLNHKDISDDEFNTELNTNENYIVPIVNSTSVSKLLPNLSSSFYDIQTEDVVKINKELCRKFLTSTTSLHPQPSEETNTEPPSKKSKIEFPSNESATSQPLKDLSPLTHLSHSSSTDSSHPPQMDSQNMRGSSPSMRFAAQSRTYDRNQATEKPPFKVKKTSKRKKNKVTDSNSVNKTDTMNTSNTINSSESLLKVRSDRKRRKKEARCARKLAASILNQVKNKKDLNAL